MERGRIKWWSSLALGVPLLTACSTDPNKEKVGYFNSGERYFNTGKYQEAVIEFQNATRIDPGFAEAHYQLARSYLSLNASEAAFRELTETVSLDPKNADAQVQLAILFIARRQYKQAQATAEQVLAKDPNNGRAHEVLGEKYAITGDLANAVREFRKAIAHDRTRVASSARLGAILLSSGRPTEAEAVLTQAIKANPKSLEARISLAQIYFIRGKAAEAEAEIRAASEQNPKAVLPSLLLARIYAATGRLADAERLCSQLKKTAPDNPQAYQALGLLYLSTGQSEKAVVELRSVSASRPKDSLVKVYLVEALIDLNRLPEAATLAGTMLRASPTDPHALLSTGRVLIHERRYQEAQAMLESAITSDPRSAGSYYLLGVAQDSLGQSTMAKGSFTRALELDPTMNGAVIGLADLNAKSGNYAEALRLANAVIKRNPNLAPAYVAAAKAWLGKGDARQGEALLKVALDHDPVSLPALEMLVNLVCQERRGRRSGRAAVKVDSPIS